MRYHTKIAVLFILLSQATVLTLADNVASSKSPFRKVGNWIDAKLNKPELSPEERLADIQIRAGQAHLESAVAKQKLDEHIYKCEQKRKKLEAEYNELKEIADNLDAHAEKLKE